MIKKAFGDKKTDELKRQSQMISEKLQQNGFDVQFKNIEKRNHVDVILDLNDKSNT